jgi:hypothetical protein
MGEETLKKEVQLVTVSAYAEKYNISRTTVYKLIEDGKLTKYLGIDGKTPMLDPNESPKDVQAYRDREEYSETEE